MRFSSDEIAAALATVRAALPPTPQYRWPLIEQALGAEVWIKHENHTPVGAFKVRGGLTYFEELRRTQPEVRQVISATRGNHGQSVGFAARRHGLQATIVVPHGNSVEKNAAMRALGVELVEHGEDFQAASDHAAALASAHGLHRIPSFHRELVRGVATAYVEFFEATKAAGGAPDVLFVPIGLGSGFAGAAAARAYCGVSTRLVGVVSAHADASLQSWRSGMLVDSPANTCLADGMACRLPVAEAMAVVRAEAEDVVAVTDDEVAAAMRLLYTATHNVAEGAGAAALAAAMQQRRFWAGQRIGVALTGGNVDAPLFAEVLAG
ncbi:threonine dehydratase [Pseudoxanthomonas winnipegensis]|uniref:threonine dehydratase n=1 Tax=Pseudoxanthomonas winnipegensis TaxID=2480810 RepID=UPI002575437D|nr:threonine dehydratase [Pseudoxanthomonas winnipegensis]WJI17504.1 threonine dehydratase [Pseudoxanthomonas winnipegensis]